MINISHRYVRKRGYIIIIWKSKRRWIRFKKANQANLKKEEEKGTTVKVDTKEDATSEEWDILHIDKIKNIE